jgi:hypothetical protein
MTRTLLMGAVAALLVVGCGVASGRTALERAASADHPARFVFVDRPDAASLMECLGAAETLVVTVDTERNAMAVRRQDETNPVVVWTADASFVDASLLTSGAGCWPRSRPRRGLGSGRILSGWVTGADAPAQRLWRGVPWRWRATSANRVLVGRRDGVGADESVGDVRTDAGPIPDLQFRRHGRCLIGRVCVGW